MTRYIPLPEHTHFPDVVNTAAVVTLSAVDHRQRTISGYTFSYDSEPDAGSTIDISLGGVSVYKHYVTAAGLGPVSIPLPTNLTAPVGVDLVSTLSASSAAKGSLTLHVVE